MAVDRRELLLGGAGVAAVAWTTPSILSVEAASAASACGGCTSAAVLYFNAGSGTHAPDGTCFTYQNVTNEICRDSTSQSVVVASDAAGTTAPYFDELAVITVTSPTLVVAVMNVIFFQDDCRDTSPGVTTVNGPGGPVDLSVLMGAECGTFEINIQARNAFNPYGYNATWVVPL